MRRLTGALAVGALGLAGIVGLGTLPASADSTTDTAADHLTERVQRIRDALTELIDNGTITDEQADAVAETLGESDDLLDHHGHGPMGGVSLSTAAEALGLAEDELRDALADGSSLADVAEANGVATADLVTALVAAAQEKIDASVADGSLDQTRADELATGLQDRITAMVEGDLPAGPTGRHGGFGGDRPEEDQTSSSTETTSTI